MNCLPLIVIGDETPIDQMNFAQQSQKLAHDANACRIVTKQFNETY